LYIIVMLIFTGFGMGEEAPAKAPADRNSAANPNDRVKVLSDLVILSFFHRASVEFKITLKPGVRMAAEWPVHIRYRKTPALKSGPGLQLAAVEDHFAGDRGAALHKQKETEAGLLIVWRGGGLSDRSWPSSGFSTCCNRPGGNTYQVWKPGPTPRV
jgi:hypothetical protein